MKTFIINVLLPVACVFIINTTYSQLNKTASLCPGKTTVKTADRNLEQSNTWLQQREGMLSFTENKGQVRDQHWKSRPDVLFSGSTGGMVFHIRNNGISYQLYKKQKMETGHYTDRVPRAATVPLDYSDPRHDLFHEKEKPRQTSIYRTDIYWEGINENFTVATDQTIPGYNNYYNVPEGNEPALSVKDYRGIWLKNIYTGIDLHYYSNERGLKYDYLVQPGADYRQIKMRIEGAEMEITEEGNVLLSTPYGIIEEGEPMAFQEGKKVKAEWVLEGNLLSLAIKDYNQSKSLIIDPPVRVWGTYYGGSQDEYGRSCTVDGNGNVFLAGYTESFTSIATIGAHQEAPGGGAWDAFLTKFNGSGVRQWGTYYGGSANDLGYGCIADSSDVFVSGYTSSTNNIATTGAHQEMSGGWQDAFLVKFNESGIRQWGTYYGGSESDNSYSCAIDNNGNVFLSGITLSSNNIATTGSHQDTHAGWTNLAYDAFLVKFNGNGVRQWGTYYGGPSYDYGNSCAADGNGNVFLAGHTTNDTNIATSGAHQDIHAGGWDAFLVKFDGSGVRQWGTYYGGSDEDQALSCAADDSGNVYLAGWTASFSGIATTGAHQDTHAGGWWDDAFLVKFNDSGVRQWGTYYGGSGSDKGYACAVDDSGNVFLTGHTASTIGIATAGADQEIFGGGNNDAFLVKVDGSGVRKWGTYYGGSERDVGMSCVIDSNGNIFLSGNTGSTNVIATTGAHQGTYGGGQWDAFLVKFGAPCTTFDTINPIACDSFISPSGNYTWTSPGTYMDIIPNQAGCDSLITINLTFNISVSISATDVSCNMGNDGEATATPSGGTAPYYYQWSNNQTTQIAIGLFVGAYTVTVTDSLGCINVDSIIIIAPDPLTLSITCTDVSIINGSDGGSVVAATGGTGPYTYQWNDINGQTTTTATGLTKRTYSVTVTDTLGCMVIDSCTVNSPGCALILQTSAIEVLCFGGSEGEAIVVPLGGILPYNYLWNNGQTSATLTGLPGGIYSVTVSDSIGCTDTASVFITSPDSPLQADAGSNASIDQGGSTTLLGTATPDSDGVNYLWTPSTGLNCTTCFSPVATPDTTTTYCVEITDVNGCSDTSCVRVTVIPEISCAEVFVPNAFSPNGDNSNDLHCILGDCIANMKMIIYNRWGAKIFESSDQGHCWDGTYKGELMNTAVFVYYLSYTTNTGEHFILQGNISLIR